MQYYLELKRSENICSGFYINKKRRTDPIYKENWTENHANTTFISYTTCITPTTTSSAMSSSPAAARENEFYKVLNDSATNQIRLQVIVAKLVNGTAAPTSQMTQKVAITGRGVLDVMPVATTMPSGIMIL